MEQIQIMKVLAPRMSLLPLTFLFPGIHTKRIPLIGKSIINAIQGKSTIVIVEAVTIYRGTLKKKLFSSVVILSADKLLKCHEILR